MRLIAFLIALFSPSLAVAASNVTLQSSVFVEKTVAGENGRPRIVLEEPKIVTPGDKLVFVLAWRNTSPAPASDFVVTNPLPAAVAFQGAADERASVSVDGGRSWGNLAQLRIRESDGQWRNARPEDVTHVRWALKQAIPAGAQGKLSFRGIVR